MLPLWEDAEECVRIARLTASQDAGEVEALIRLFEVVAGAEGWQPGGALREVRWRRRSVYFALEVRGQLAGGLQLLLPHPGEPLPCQAPHLWPEARLLPSDSFTAAHISILALAPAFRGEGKLFWPLAIEMWRACVAEEVEQLYLEVTPRVLPIYRRLGWPLQVRGDLRPHWGEACYLCSLGVWEVAAALSMRAKTSSSYRSLVTRAFRPAPREPMGTEVREHTAAYSLAAAMTAPTLV